MKKTVMTTVSKGSGEEFGLIGFILGLLSIVFVGSNGIIIAILGFAFSITQQRRKPTRLGKWGLVLSVIGFILAIIMIIWVLTVIGPELETQLAGAFPNN